MSVRCAHALINSAVLDTREAVGCTSKGRLPRQAGPRLCPATHARLAVGETLRRGRCCSRGPCRHRGRHHPRNAWFLLARPNDRPAHRRDGRHTRRATCEHDCPIVPIENFAAQGLMNRRTPRRSDHPTGRPERRIPARHARNDRTRRTQKTAASPHRNTRPPRTRQGTPPRATATAGAFTEPHAQIRRTHDQPHQRTPPESAPRRPDHRSPPTPRPDRGYQSVRAHRAARPGDANPKQLHSREARPISVVTVIG